MLSTLLIGLIVGALAKLVMPGKDPGGIIITIVLGIATASPLMVEAALVIAAFGCVGTIALARSAQRAAPGD